MDVNDAFYEHTLFGFDIMISSKEGDMLVVNTDEESVLSCRNISVAGKFLFTHNRRTEIVDSVKLFVS